MAENTRVVTVAGQTGRIIVARILPGSDLVSGLIELCKAAYVRTGVINVCVGSLKRAQFHWTIPSTKTKRGSERTEPVVLEGPLEFLVGQGMIGQSTTGQPHIHFHATLCDKEGRVHGGHFFVGGNIVHSTMDVVITEVENVDFVTRHDPEIDLELPMVVAQHDQDGSVR